MGLLNFLKKVPEPRDDFEVRVRELVTLHGPADALEESSARRMATEVLVHGIVEANNREAAGAPLVDADRNSRFRRALARSITPVVHAVVRQRVGAADTVGAIIVRICFGEQWAKPYLDTGEIPWLVGVAYGVALELQASHPDLAQQLAMPDEPQSKPEQKPATAVEGEGHPLGALERELWGLLVQYGQTSDEQLIQVITPLYVRALQEVAQSRRLEMLLTLIRLVEERKLSGNALMPFIFRDTDEQVVSTAALHAAAVWPGSEEDPVTGIRELAAYARQCAREGDEQRSAAILAGLVLLGDRRVTACVGPCWRHLSSEGRHLLAAGIRGRAYAAVIDWLVSWLEECEGGEFGAVAATLARIPELEHWEGVVDVRRAMPVWSVPADAVVTDLQTCSFDAYGERLRPRLLQIAADEQSPRVMYDVLRAWGINHTRRHVPGVAMRVPGALEPPRPLLSLLSKAALGPSGATPYAVPLDDADFLARDGRLLLCWAIFNPYGPTWSCLGLLPTEDPEVYAVFYRLLNPFLQQSVLLSVVRDVDLESGAALGRIVEALFAHECIEPPSGDPVYLIGGGVPDVFEVQWSDPAFGQAVRRALLGSPRLRELDVVRAIREIREFSRRPWDRASAQRQEAFDRMTPEGVIPLLEPEGDTTDAVIDEWLARVTDEEYWMAELLNLPAAWHGAIDNATPTLAQTAYTYWQLDEFLARYGYTTMREIADAWARREARAATAAGHSPADEPSDDLGATAEQEPDYRTAHADLRRRLETFDGEKAKPADFVYAIGASLIARQMAAAEEECAAAGKSTEELRRMMRKPWALGYCCGVAFALIEQMEVPRDSHHAESVLTEIHRAGLGRVAAADIVALSRAVTGRPEFADGMQCGGQDAIMAAEGRTSARSLLAWIGQQSHA